jgi:hypothetical protein
MHARTVAQLDIERVPHPGSYRTGRADLNALVLQALWCAPEDMHKRRQPRTLEFEWFNRHYKEERQMNQLLVACAIGVTLCISSAASAQTSQANPPNSATSLQGADNTSEVPAHPTTRHKKKKSKRISKAPTGTDEGIPRDEGETTGSRPGH